MDHLTEGPPLRNQRQNFFGIHFSFNFRGISIWLNRIWGENITFSIFSLVYISVRSARGHFFQKKKYPTLGRRKRGPNMTKMKMSKFHDKIIS